MCRPLDGVTVVDLTQALSGPLCAGALADWGAQVIKVENCNGSEMSRGINYNKALEADPINGGDSFNAINRNKSGVCINQRTEEGREIMRKILRHTDVLISNYRPGTTKKMGIDYETLHALYPELIVCEICAFHEEARANEPGYDLAIQAASGVIGSTGFPGQPCKVAFSVADVSAGMAMTQGVLLALLARQKTGRGQYVRVTMQDSVLYLFYQHVTPLLTIQDYDVLPNGLEHVESAPNGGYHCKDGIICIVPSSNKMFAIFAEKILGQPKLIAEERFSDPTLRMLNRNELREIIESKFATMTVDEVMCAMRAEGLPASKIFTPKQAFQRAYDEHDPIVATVHHPKFHDLPVIGSPIEMSESKPIIDKPAPRLGQDTERILREMAGLNGMEIADLESKNIVRCLHE